MRKIWIASLVLLVSLFAGRVGKTQTLSFKLNRPGAPPAQFTIMVNEMTGRGTYHAEAPTPDGAPVELARSAETPLVVEPATLRKLLAAIPLVLSGRCETHMKKIAQTGTKILRYEREGKTSECTYNYSDEQRVNEATSQFEAIGETMQYGDRLAAKLRFDRLGLDAEVDELGNALAGGRAVGVGNIAPILKTIEDDDRVMDRVRRKIARMLTGAGGAAGQPSPDAPGAD